MRALRTLYARQDLVEMLVRQGRLADIQMLHFFSAQLDRQLGAAAAVGEAAAVTNSKTDSAASAQPTPPEGTATEAAAAVDVHAKVDSRGDAKRKAWTAFHNRSDAVYRLAAKESPVAWLREVHGDGDEWSSSFPRASSAVARRMGEEASAALKVTGVVTAVGHPSRQPQPDAATAAHGTPKSIRVVLRLEDSVVGTGKETPTYVTASVKLDQPGVVEKSIVNGTLQVRLCDADATAYTSLPAEQVASYQHVLTATAYNAILGKVEEVCALHATNTERYDALLIRNPAMQMRLAQLACFRYGITCLRDYVVGDPEASEDGDAGGLFSEGEPCERLPLPLVESMALNIYAERALMDGIDGMWEMVRDTPLVEAVAHRSNPTKMIDYPYLAQLLNTSKFLLTSSDGSLEEQSLTFLHPLLRRSSLSGGDTEGAGSYIAGVLRGLVGLTSGPGRSSVRLAAPHVNLSGMAATVERDVATFLHVIATEKDKMAPLFVICAAQYVSELLANLAVIYRCTAALNADEEGRGHREWLLAQAFGASSAVRRQRLLDDYQMFRAAARVIKSSAELDSYSTHPIELMNAPPRKAKASMESKSERVAASKT